MVDVCHYQPLNSSSLGKSCSMLMLVGSRALWILREAKWNKYAIPLPLNLGVIYNSDWLITGLHPSLHSERVLQFEAVTEPLTPQ